MTSSDRFPVLVRSAVKSNLTDWCFQNLSKRALNALTVQASGFSTGTIHSRERNCLVTFVLINCGTTMSPPSRQKLEWDCGSWNSWEEQAFGRMICCTIIRQLFDLFSNMRAHVGRQVLRKNRRNNLKMFSVVLFRSFLTKHVVHVTFCH